MGGLLGDTIKWVVSLGDTIKWVVSMGSLLNG